MPSVRATTEVKRSSNSLAALAIIACTFLSACTSYDTRPILDASGTVVPGSIAKLERVSLGGVPQWILVRGNSAKNPILLKLHGGPGQAEMATVGLNRLLESDFVVVEWDQRGAGKSASSVEPVSAMNLEQIVSDTLELTEILLKRFDKPGLILVGHSWGGIVGLKAVQRRPDFYQAFVSTGQIANYAAGLEAGYDFLLLEAGRRNNTAALRDLRRIGHPPYDGADSKAKRETHLDLLMDFGGLWHSAAKFDRVGWMVSSVEYAWPEKLRFPLAADRAFSMLLPDLIATDLSISVPAIQVPVYFAVGRFDYMAPAQVSRAYFDRLVAPRKQWISFENSAHFPQWEEVEKFHDLLSKKVLPEVQGRDQPSRREP
jgi:pimeloyl-ACP methyl ester carboxylesterase